MINHLLKYAYFPGCVAQGACRELHQSTQELAQALGIHLVELKQAACCGSGTFKEDSWLLEDVVNARNIALAEQLQLPLLTHCSTCQGVIGHVDERLKDFQASNPDYLGQINGLLQQQGCRPYQVLRETLDASLIRRPAGKRVLRDDELDADLAAAPPEIGAPGHVHPLVVHEHSRAAPQPLGEALDHPRFLFSIHSRRLLY
jgi:hypothetical protein